MDVVEKSGPAEDIKPKITYKRKRAPTEKQLAALEHARRVKAAKTESASSATGVPPPTKSKPATRSAEGQPAELDQKEKQDLENAATEQAEVGDQDTESSPAQEPQSDPEPLTQAEMQYLELRRAHDLSLKRTAAMEQQLTTLSSHMESLSGIRKELSALRRHYRTARLLDATHERIAPQPRGAFAEATSAQGIPNPVKLERVDGFHATPQRPHNSTNSGEQYTMF